MYAAPKGRTHGSTRPACINVTKTLANREPSTHGYQPTLERLSVGVRSPPESRPSDRAIQPVGDQCLVPATKRTLDVTRVYARL